MTTVHPEQQPPTPQVVYYPEPVPEKPSRLRRAQGTNTVVRRVVDADGPPDSINHPLYVVEGVIVVGGFAHLADVAPAWFVGAGVLGAVVGGVSTKIRFTTSGIDPNTGRRLPDPHAAQIATYTAVSSAAAGGALAVASEMSPFSALGAVVIGGAVIVLSPLYGLLRHRNTKAVLAEIEKRAEKRSEAQRNEWISIFEKVKANDISIADITDELWTHGKREFPAGFALALDLGEDAPEGNSLAAMTPAIEKVAAARLKLPIRSGAIQINQRGYAHQWEIIIPTRDILDEKFDFIPATEPQSVNDPFAVAYAVDGTPVELDLMEDPHGLISGQTNWGKSNYLDVHAGRLAECEDNVTWVICGDKPDRYFAAWMAPFLRGDVDADGNPVEPPFDWIAWNLEEACMMLCDIIKGVYVRQKTAGQDGGATKWIPTKDRPRVTILMDESVSLLQRTRYKVKPYNWDGPTVEEDEENGQVTGMTFGELLLEALRVARSEGWSLIFSVQRSTATMMGGDGANQKSQVNYRAGFHDTGGNDTVAIFNSETSGVDTTSLPKGGLYVEMSGYNRPVLSKTPLMEPKDKETVTVTWSKLRGPLDDYTARELDFYATRWDRAQEFLQGLIPNPVRTYPGQSSRHTPPAAPVEVEAEQDSSLDEVVEDFGEWMRANHPDFEGDVTEEIMAEYGQHLLDTNADVREVLRNARAGGTEPTQDQAEIEMLEAMYAAEHHESEPEPEPMPYGSNIDPSLPPHTRQLLGLLAGSDLLYDEWVLSDEILALAIEQLGWPAQKPGFQRVKEALEEVSVVQPKNPPKLGGKRKRRGYHSADVKAAIDYRSIERH